MPKASNYRGPPLPARTQVAEMQQVFSLVDFLLTATMTGTYHRTRIKPGGASWQTVVLLAGSFPLAVIRSTTLRRLSSIEDRIHWSWKPRQ